MSCNFKYTNLKNKSFQVSVLEDFCSRKFTALILFLYLFLFLESDYEADVFDCIIWVNTKTNLYNDSFQLKEIQGTFTKTEIM